MKSLLVFFMLIIGLNLFVNAQVIEGSSGKSTFNISKPKQVETKQEVVQEKVEEIKIEEQQPVIKVLPVIKWVSPTEANHKATVNSLAVNICISSEKELSVISFYQNDQLLREMEYGSRSFRSDCDFVIAETVKLKIGENRFKVIATNTDGTATSEIAINFDLSPGKYYALLIGVQDYMDSKINDLDEPVKDATALYQTLTEKYMFDKENVILLKNPTKSQIVKTLFDMRKTLTNSDNLLIFYAGHGYWDEAMQSGYWLPADAEKDNPVNWFSNSDLRGYIKAIPSKHTLLIADACFSGGIFKTRVAFSDAPVSIMETIKIPSRKAMTSGTMNVVPDQSVFMDYFLRRLNANNEDFLSAEKLFVSFKDAVINNSPVNQVPQYGEIREAGDEGGDFIFIKR